MGEAWHFGFLQHFRKYFKAQNFFFSVDPAVPNLKTETDVWLLCNIMTYLYIWGKLDISASFNISGNILGTQKFSFSVDSADLNSNTNTFVLLLCYKMNYLCIWGKLDISDSFNISVTILRPKSFPIVLTPYIRT